MYPIKDEYFRRGVFWPVPRELQHMSKEQAQSKQGSHDESMLEPLRSVHTSSFPDLLSQLGSSLMVSTYQAGKLIMLRPELNDESLVLNTHFRNLLKPMGIALDERKLAIGTSFEIHEFCNVPAVCERLDPPNRHDACFMPRRSHTTGDVAIHEMAWIGEDLWFVNTAFSCLATRCNVNSFQPRWRPAFVKHLQPGDACHLNGMAIRDGAVR